MKEATFPKMLILTAVAWFMMAGGARAQLTNGLVGYWPLDGNLNNVVLGGPGGLLDDDAEFVDAALLGRAINLRNEVGADNIEADNGAFFIQTDAADGDTPPPERRP